MSRATLIVLAIVVVMFAVSWVSKASVMEEDAILNAFLVTFAAFLTLCILSFLYQDNPFYKFAEHLFVGISAAYWMVLGFWSTFVGNLVPKFQFLANWFGVEYQPGTYNFAFVVPVILGVMLLMRLSKDLGWMSRWPLAFIIGTTAGLNFIRYLRSDFINQVQATLIPLVVDWRGFGTFFDNLSLAADGQLALMVSNLVIFLGTFCGLIYFFFSKEHKGAFGVASRVGIWLLMVTFGASFGYTVMGRISLLVGRITFLFRDWLGLIGS